MDFTILIKVVFLSISFNWYPLGDQNVGMLAFHFWELLSSDIFDCFFFIVFVFLGLWELMILMLFLLNSPQSSLTSCLFIF